MVFFTADQHWGHAAIIKHCARPFADVNEMNAALVTNWNNTVGPDDTVYHLGDMLFKRMNHTSQLLNSLNGKIYLVRGNHDKDLKRLADRAEPWPDGAKYKDLVTIRLQDSSHPHGHQDIILCHFALRVWDKKHYGSFHCFAHSHGKLKTGPHEYAIDVGVDTHDFKPISYERIKEIFKAKEPMERGISTANITYGNEDMDK